MCVPRDLAPKDTVHARPTLPSDFLFGASEGEDVPGRGCSPVCTYSSLARLGDPFLLVMVMSAEYRTEVCSKLYIGF